MQITPYLNFDGQCRAAFQFYERCLGGQIPMMMTYGESPMAAQTPAEQRDRIMHTRLQVGDAMLMGSDMPPEPCGEGMKGSQVTIGVDNPAEAERIFNALSEGGTVRMPIQETFWAVRFGMLVDKFGISWMVNCERPT